MLHVEENIAIARPPDEVFAFITDPRNNPMWQTSVEESEILNGGDVRVGARNRTVVRFLGKRFEMVFEISAYDPPKRVAYQKLEGPFDASGSYTVEPEDGGSRVTSVYESPGLEGFFGSIADPVFTRLQSREVTSDLEKLKVLLEDGSEQ